MGRGRPLLKGPFAKPKGRPLMSDERLYPLAVTESPRGKAPKCVRSCGHVRIKPSLTKSVAAPETHSNGKAKQFWREIHIWKQISRERVSRGFLIESEMRISRNFL